MQEDLRNRQSSAGDAPIDASEEQIVAGSGLSVEQLQLLQDRDFELLGQGFREDLQTQFMTLRHKASGATVSLIQNDDPHLRAELCFRSLPTDSSGVFHILEHAVISDAPSIPVGDAFEELTRSLMLTGVNATTYADRTRYYAQGVDAYSVETMTRVFAEAVLGGVPSYETFCRERGYLHPGENDGEFSFRGTVHDEMKSKYSSIQTWAIRALMKSMAPGTTFDHHSGGNPLAMLDLSYDEFKQAYEATYSASKAFIGLYGNTPLEDNLSLVEELLAGQKTDAAPAAIPAVDCESGPRTETVKIPVDTESKQPPEQQFRRYHSYGFKPSNDRQEEFELEVLSLLLGQQAHSPFATAFREKKIDAVLEGGDINSLGDGRFLLFGFTNSSEEDLNRCSSTMQEIVTSLITNGIPRAAIDAELNTIALKSEAFNRSTSKNEDLLTDSILEAMQGEFASDPLSPIDRIQLLRDKLDRGERVFEELLERYVLVNDNVATITLIPDATVVPDWKKARMDKVSAQVAALDQTGLEEARIFAEAMEQREIERNDYSQVSRVPKAVLDAAYRLEPIVEKELLEKDGARILLHPQGLMGDAVQLSIAFDISDFSAEEVVLADFLLHYACERGPQGTVDGAFGQATRSISTGLSTDRAPMPMYLPNGETSYITMLKIGTGTRAGSLGQLVESIAKALLTPALDEQGALADLAKRAEFYTQLGANNPNLMINSLVSQLSAAMSPVGSHATAASSSDGSLGILSAINEGLANDFDNFSAALEKLRIKLVCRERLRINVVTGPEHCATAGMHLTSFIDRLPQGGPQVIARAPYAPTHDSIGLVSEINNNFVGQRVQLRDASGEQLALNGSGDVACQIMNRFLNQQVRKIGGAYGATSFFVDSIGHLAFLSWRDPNVSRTLDVYKQAAEFLLSTANEDLLERAKVAALRPLERPLTPEQKGERSFHADLMNYSHQQRLLKRAGILDTTLRDVEQFAHSLEAGLNRECAIRIYGNRSNLEKAVQEGVPLTLQARFS